jgi:hypothetical protein
MEFRVAPRARQYDEPDERIPQAIFRVMCHHSSGEKTASSLRRIRIRGERGHRGSVCEQRRFVHLYSRGA